jgi:hypothetical protein
MKISVTQNKYKEGEVVYANSDPKRKLVISRYIDRIYYCYLQQNPSIKNLLFYERQLKASE